MITSADKPRLLFDDFRQEWQLITPVVLAPPQLAITVSYCKGVYLKRIQGEIGARRKRMQDAILKLNPSVVKQFIIGSGEKILYHADKL